METNCKPSCCILGIRINLLTILIKVNGSNRHVCILIYCHQACVIQTINHIEEILIRTTHPVASLCVNAKLSIPQAILCIIIISTIELSVISHICCNLSSCEICLIKSKVVSVSLYQSSADLLCRNTLILLKSSDLSLSKSDSIYILLNIRLIRLKQCSQCLLVSKKVCLVVVNITLYSTNILLSLIIRVKSTDIRSVESLDSLSICHLKLIKLILQILLRLSKLLLSINQSLLSSYLCKLHSSNCISLSLLCLSLSLLCLSNTSSVLSLQSVILELSLLDLLLNLSSLSSLKSSLCLQKLSLSLSNNLLILSISSELCSLCLLQLSLSSLVSSLCLSQYLCCSSLCIVKSCNTLKLLSLCIANVSNGCRFLIRYTAAKQECEASCHHGNFLHNFLCLKLINKLFVI